jgi:hypothetical protein
MKRVLTSPPAICLYLLLAAWLKFGAWTPTAFFGDDLMAYLDFIDGKLASSFSQALFHDWYAKYRPVVQLFWFGTFSAFGAEHHLHVAVCYAIHVACGTLVYAIALRLSGSVLISLAAALIFTTVRFVFLNLIVIGPVESLPLLLLLLALRISLPLYESPDQRGAVSAALGIILLGGLSIFGHERFLAATPWMAAVIFFAPALQALPRINRIALAALAFAPALINNAYKALVLNSALNVGSGGHALTIDPYMFGKNALYGILSTFGINRGHPFWNGHEVKSVADPALWLSLAFIAGVVWLVLRLRKRDDNGPLQVWILLLVALGVLMMIPPFLANPMQPRWLLLPAAFLMFFLAWAHGAAMRAGDRKSMAIVPACFVLYFAADLVCSRDYQQFYLVDLSRMTGALARAAPNIPPGRVDTIQAINSWATLNGAFFRVYGGHGQTREMGYHFDTKAWLADPKSGDTAWIYDGKEFTEITRPKP